jgi:hypothetical protein
MCDDEMMPVGFMPACSSNLNLQDLKTHAGRPMQFESARSEIPSVK